MHVNTSQPIYINSNIINIFLHRDIFWIISCWKSFLSRKVHAIFLNAPTDTFFWKNYLNYYNLILLAHNGLFLSSSKILLKIPCQWIFTTLDSTSKKFTFSYFFLRLFKVSQIKKMHPMFRKFHVWLIIFQKGGGN